MEDDRRRSWELSWEGVEIRDRAGDSSLEMDWPPARHTNHHQDDVHASPTLWNSLCTYLRCYCQCLSKAANGPGGRPCFSGPSH